MADSVGAVSFDLIIQDTMKKQLNVIAKNAESPAAGVGKSIGEAISSPIQKAVDDAGKSLDDIIKNANKKSVYVPRTPDDAPLKSVPLTGSTLASNVVKKEQPEAPQSVKIGDVFKVAEDSVGRLNQKLDITNSKIGEQEEKLRSLVKRYEEVANSKGTGSADAKGIDSQITTVQAKLISLRDTADQTERQIEKALNASGGATSVSKAADNICAKMKKAASGTDSVFKKAMKSVGSSVSNAFGSAKAKVSNSVKSIQHKVSGLSRSVKSAFKSAFLMAGLYAAFRGIRSLIGDAVSQNEEFSNSLKLIKSNLQVAFTPILQTIQPMLNTLAAGFANVSKQIAAITAGMFGQTYQQAAAATKKLNSVSKEAKKAGQLASFDELNVLSNESSDESSDEGDDTYADPATANYDETISFGQKLKDMLTSISAGVGPFIASLSTKIAEAAPSIATAGVQIIQALLAGINDHAPEIIASAVTVINTFMTGLGQLLPQIGPFAVNAIMFLAQSFLAYAPQLLIIGIELLTSVLQGLSQNIPELIPVVQDAIFAIVQAITDNLPVILTAGMTILTHLIQGIAEMLPELIPMAVDCVITLVQGLVDNLPMLIDAAIDLIVALALGILNALPILLEQAPKIISSLVDGLVGAIPLLIDAAIQIILGLVDFFINNLDKMASCAINIMVSLASGLIKAVPELIKAVLKLIKSLVNKIMNTDWIQVGKDILAGIGDGLMKGVTAIGDTIKNVASGIVDGFKSFFGIHSPSKLFKEEIGANLALGIGAGFDDEMVGVTKSMQDAVPTPELKMIKVSSTGTISSHS